MSLNTNQDMFSGSALSNNDKYTSFAQVLQTFSSDELDYLVPENGPAGLLHPQNITDGNFHQINKADDLPLNFERDSLQVTKSLRQILNIVLKRFLDHLGPKFQYLRVDDLQGYWQMESWKIHQSKTNHDQ
ncbi:hypothetical protein BY996DRAFT_6563887 [Phakopsora pachyrhizi]|uniref:Uncharacterized protein n=1 Tax=Phakopsora pachyrhizi TaxID=170000 RepID=A0AAV0AVK2_PHAPC|nr:hypothetical protein BY996DRAFT_6563887 [Phakopsora pachyrhizi]CAH7673028.1 hypothetical protein PPACK8108_LOCUS7880 [Phakopsora pachyrhizi]